MSSGTGHYIDSLTETIRQCSRQNSKWTYKAIILERFLKTLGYDASELLYTEDYEMLCEIIKGRMEPPIKEMNRVQRD